MQVVVRRMIGRAQEVTCRGAVHVFTYSQAILPLISRSNKAVATWVMQDWSRANERAACVGVSESDRSNVTVHLIEQDGHNTLLH